MDISSEPVTCSFCFLVRKNCTNVGGKTEEVWICPDCIKKKVAPELFITCPVCLTEYDKHDSPDEYARVIAHCNQQPPPQPTPPPEKKGEDNF